MAATRSPRRQPRTKPKVPVHDSGFSTPSLDRALAVLHCLGGHPQGLTLSEIAEALKLSVNFVYRVTQSLVSHGYLVRDAEKRFSVGAALLKLCQPVIDDVPLAEAALPAMRWLSDQTGEAAHLGILSGFEGIVLERVIGRAMIKFYVERGTRFPLHTSGPGKVMLAFTPEAERDEIIAGMKFERFQPWTISNRKDFLKCLAQARNNGFAVDVGEHLEGHHCLAAPILDADGNAMASLWITGPSQRLSEERMAKLTAVVKQAGAMATAALRGGALVA
ncbi:IclR family transcriptional regulator [Prosthecobacter sp.]|uniref:IclR family transcriptional regulator n=1 Tax=Prosthecobacter sp. TaxID=1965333 RepID=UPI0024883B6C|nr:IclR family transcriptional regulator [Prosthecobacter sp.]MDI1315083.1 IclR family transcriptional regulator [Prosthecobacter sp.]